jgi:DNA-binding NarL/FixJ family response regulator
MDFLIGQLMDHRIKVVVLDSVPNVSSAIHIFKLGARGYLNTFASAHRVQQVINTLQDGQVWVGQDILSQIIQAEPSNHENNTWQEGLTKRKIQIIGFLLEGKTNQIIADNLHLSIATIKKEINALFERFSAQDRLDLVLKIKNY